MNFTNSALADVVRGSGFVPEGSVPVPGPIHQTLPGAPISIPVDALQVLSTPAGGHSGQPLIEGQIDSTGDISRQFEEDAQALWDTMLTPPRRRRRHSIAAPIFDDSEMFEYRANEMFRAAFGSTYFMLHPMPLNSVNSERFNVSSMPVVENIAPRIEDVQMADDTVNDLNVQLEERQTSDNESLIVTPPASPEDVVRSASLATRVFVPVRPPRNDVYLRDLVAISPNLSIVLDESTLITSGDFDEEVEHSIEDNATVSGSGDNDARHFDLSTMPSSSKGFDVAVPKESNSCVNKDVELDLFRARAEATCTMSRLCHIRRFHARRMLKVGEAAMIASFQKLNITGAGIKRKHDGTDEACASKCRRMEPVPDSPVAASLDCVDFDDSATFENASSEHFDESLVGVSHDANSTTQNSESETPYVNIDTVCRECRRFCGCPQMPMDSVKASNVADVEAPAEKTETAMPVPARRRRKRQITTDPWQEVQPVEAFGEANLPAPHDVVVGQRYVVQFEPLTSDRLLSEVRGDAFIAGMYLDGVIVLQGRFEDVPNAFDRTKVILNTPEDPVRQISAGANHLAMVSEAGHLYMIGRATEGQLGRCPSRYRHLSPTASTMRRRVVPVRERGQRGRIEEIRFAEVVAQGNLTTAWSRGGEAYRCGTSEDGSWSSSSFRRVPEWDH